MLPSRALCAARSTSPRAGFWITDEGQHCRSKQPGRCRPRSASGPHLPLAFEAGEASLNHVSRSKRGATRAIRWGNRNEPRSSGDGMRRRAWISSASDARIPISCICPVSAAARGGEPSLEPTVRLPEPPPRLPRAVTAGQRDVVSARSTRQSGKRNGLPRGAAKACRTDH